LTPAQILERTRQRAFEKLEARRRAAEEVARRLEREKEAEEEEDEFEKVMAMAFAKTVASSSSLKGVDGNNLDNTRDDAGESSSSFLSFKDNEKQVDDADGEMPLDDETQLYESAAFHDTVMMDHESDDEKLKETNFEKLSVEPGVRKDMIDTTEKVRAGEEESGSDVGIEITEEKTDVDEAAKEKSGVNEMVECDTRVGDSREISDDTFGVDDTAERDTGEGKKDVANDWPTPMNSNENDEFDEFDLMDIPDEFKVFQ
jgi:hypothetical protein